jgi:RNA polymerase sigma-70 factor (ECF subfamily)
VSQARDLALSIGRSIEASESFADRPFEAFFREQYPRLVRTLTRVVGEAAQAEELAADAFGRLHARYADLGADARVSWVFRTGINLAIDALRANARRLRREVAAGEASWSPPDALGDLLARETQRRVRLVLARLPRQQARVLILASQGWSYREAAGVLGLRPDSIYVIAARARARFEREYLRLQGERP